LRKDELTPDVAAFALRRPMDLRLRGGGQKRTQNERAFRMKKSVQFLKGIARTGCWAVAAAWRGGGGAAAPLYLSRVAAGFPSPADDYVESALDLNAYLVRNPAATFMVKVSGDSMIGAGIADGDVLVVDRSEEAVHGRIVVAVLDGEMTVKRLQVRKGRPLLVPENPAYEAVRIEPGQELNVWGVVTGVVKRV
jgi:DNA polymerase V